MNVVGSEDWTARCAFVALTLGWYRAYEAIARQTSTASAVARLEGWVGKGSFSVLR